MLAERKLRGVLRKIALTTVHSTWWRSVDFHLLKKAITGASR